jgi:hypothetical protein
MGVDESDHPRNAALSAFAGHLADLVQAEAEARAETLGGLPQVQIICIAGEDMETVGLNIEPLMMADAMTDICAAWAAEGEIDLADLDHDEGEVAPHRPN